MLRIVFAFGLVLELLAAAGTARGAGEQARLQQQVVSSFLALGVLPAPQQP